jgi:serine/threonine protein kinase
MTVFAHFYVYKVQYNYKVSLLIQLVVHGGYLCLYYCNNRCICCRKRKKQISLVAVYISCVGHVLAILMNACLLPSLISGKTLSEFEIGFLFAANVVGLSSYTVALLFRYLFVPAPTPAWQQQEQEDAGRRLQLQTIQELPREFSLAEITSMTQDFGTMVGQGGSAQVFRGLLGDGTPVAVKRITTTTTTAGALGDAEFLREVTIVASVHHRSLVRLLGYGLPRGGDDGGGHLFRFLVYPFFENGSLDAWLFRGGEERRRLLPWPVRRRIAVDVARALAYLHHECCRRILHLDVKPGNILLDGDLRAHLSDFGISVSITEDLASVVDTRGRGTMGYMAPEMLVNAVSAKSDVFSYGMTLLELVGGRRNFEPSSSTGASSTATPDLARNFFPCIVREKMARGQLMDAVDAAIMDAAAVDETEVDTVVKVALCCIQRARDMRPTMLTVVDMLEGRVAADLPPPSEARSSPSAVNSSSLEPLSSSLTHGGR